jgi:hypothetical protein
MFKNAQFLYNNDLFPNYEYNKLVGIHYGSQDLNLQMEPVH